MLDSYFKECSKCDEYKELSCFYKHIKSKDGYRTYCKDCSNSYNRENKEHLAAKHKEWLKNNPDKVALHEKKRAIKRYKTRKKTVEDVKKEYIGKKFYLLTIIDVFQKPGIHGYFFKCICECNKTIERSKESLLQSKGKKSCGCLNSLPNNESAFNSLISSYRLHAKQRNYSFELTEEQFKILTKQNCFYCNKKPTQAQRSKKSVYIYNGVDRKNNKIGYTLENSVACCKMCNRMKLNFPFEDFINQIKVIAKRFEEIK